LIDWQGLQGCQLTHQLGFRDSLNRQPSGRQIKALASGSK
jgi:hypothetical protein